MNTKLFKDTLAIINKCFPKSKNITDDEFLYFLLGYNGTGSGNDEFLIAQGEALGNCLAGKKTLRATLGEKYTNIRLQSSKLQLKDLVKACPKIGGKDIHDTQERLSGMQNELHDLCKKYSLPCSGSENVEHMFRELFTACITENSACLFASQKKQQLKPATLKDTLGRTGDSESLLQCLEQYHKIIIPGQHGSGKSRFIQYCLSTWNLPDYCYISYEIDLEVTKHSILFYKDKDQIVHTSLSDLMDSSYSSSLLVIDRMDDSDNFTEELEELASYAINVIVITTSNINSGAFHIFKPSPLSDDVLLRIFKNISGISLTGQEQELLFDVSQKNVLLISLISGQYKQLAKDSANSSGILSELLSSLDNTLSVHLPLATDGSATFKHSYDRKTLDILGHIKSIYAAFAAKYTKTDPLRRTMRFLCCFGYSAIPLPFLKLFSEYSQQAIDTLSDMGWILKTDSTIQLPSLIAYSVFAFEIPEVADCYGLVDMMYSFLDNYDQTLNISYLSNTLYTFAHSINRRIKVNHNRKQGQDLAKFEHWQNFITSICYYYMENGDLQLAEKIMQIIDYPDVSHEHNKYDLFYLQLAIHMPQQEYIKRIPEEIDKLTAILEKMEEDILKNKETILFANSAPALIATMDVCVYLFCSCYFNYYNNFHPDNITAKDFEGLKEYRLNLFITIDKILYGIPDPNRSKLSSSQSRYYHLCHTLMGSPERISSRLFEPFIQESTVASSDSCDLASQLLAETNLNYRIRSIAFTMFMRSIYRSDLHPSVYPVDSQMLILTINSDINQLHKQITACEHIPWHTTWLCLYSYLQLMAERSTIYKKCNQYNTAVYPSYILKSLLCRSTFSKKELSKAYEKITP